MKLELEYPRTALACLLIIVAVAVPCGAWFFSGLHQVERDAELADAEVHWKGRKKSDFLAERLASRLETLRRKESSRPFYHFQNLYYDPKGVAKGVARSPLSHGPTDLIVEAHFQIDADGHLGLPTLNDVFPELGFESGIDSQCNLLWQLRDVAAIQAAGTTVATSTFDSQDATVETLSAAAWRRHVWANEIYAGQKYDRGTDELDSAIGEPGDDVEIIVAPFTWTTLEVDDRPRLAALRRVETPDGPWTQGFLLSECTLQQMLENASYPASFLPDATCQGDAECREVVSPVDGTSWHVTVDISAPLLTVASDAETARAAFLRTFAFGSVGAVIASLLVVAMVFNSERLAQQRAQFAAAAAHELRTPLAGLRLYGEMLAEGLGDPSRSREYARRLASEAERLGRVVTNVLSFSRLERGGHALHLQAGDLGQAVREAYDRQQAALAGTGAGVSLTIEDHLPQVAFDRDAMDHIVQNLLDNAEKYTRDVEGRQIDVELRRVDDQVVLSIGDNGHGLPKSLRRSLFRPFRRGVGEGAPEGLGLGLVLVRMLARAQGAEVTYHDADGGG
ncbi:MAG: HAMP domain-containing sensor histidine kinase, partial [Acidobacteriota bacterium]